MGFISYTNTSALRIARDMTKTGAALGRTYEELTTGQRRRSEDAAAYALADRIRANSKEATAAIGNVTHGISLLAIANSAVDAIENIFRRMDELAVQSSNEMMKNQDRSALAQEFGLLADEATRIAATTTYNGQVLLSNSSQIFIQAGITGGLESRIAIQPGNYTLSAFALQGTSTELAYSIIGNTDLASKFAAETCDVAMRRAITDLEAQRGMLTAGQSRLEHAVDNLQSQRANLDAADSRITDIDVAHSVATMLRQQVLQQAQQAVFAQANLQPEQALSLLDM